MNLSVDKKTVFIAGLVLLSLSAFSGRLFIPLMLFSLSTLILYYVGRLPLIDFDPVPFTTAIVLLFFGIGTALPYAVLTIIIGDLITARFNQWSFINLSSLLPAVLLLSLVNLNPMIYIISVVALFNIIRTVISMAIGFRQAIIWTSFNTFVYLIVSCIVLPLIQAGVMIYR